MFKYKKISFLITILLSLGFVACSNKNQQNIQSNTQEKQVTTKTDNVINGVDLNVLTKEEFEQAIQKGKEYKGKNTGINNVNAIVRSNEQFQQDWGSIFLVQTPYIKVVNASKSIAEKYLELNDKSITEELKKTPNILDSIACSAYVGGNSMDFIKDVHIVLKVYGDEEKVLQPINIERKDMADLLGVESNPMYASTIMGLFNAKEVQKLNPKQIEIIVIYPNGKEVKQKFDYSKLNKL